MAEEEKVKEEKKEVEVPENLKKIVKEIEEMKLIDLAQLVKVLEEKFGVSAMPMMAMSMATAPGAAPAESGGKAKVNVVLTASGEKKIDVIKVVKEITQQGLKECKDLVDASANEPKVIKEGVKKEEAEEMKKKLEAAGAKVELK
jgi:large subunit ribosomal protein L7/L12